ncbi:hypothetical protein [Yoonia sp. BS5-3]|uniref:DUF2125 domain-containing protein n=1 Tax=Yoonia phaeophyticola TaxID=3137369 RepID=A0ABZ2V1Y8_9RHOB
MHLFKKARKMNLLATSCLSCALVFGLTHTATAQTSAEQIWEEASSLFLPNYLSKLDSSEVPSVDRALGTIHSFEREDQADGSVIIRALELEVKMGRGKAVMLIDEITIAQNEQGDVSIQLPTQFLISHHERASARQPDLYSVFSSGLMLTVEDFDAYPTYRLTADSASIDGPGHDELASLGLSFRDLDISYTISAPIDIAGAQDDTLKLAQHVIELSAGAVNADFDISGRDHQFVVGSVNLDNLSFSANLGTFDVRQEEIVVSGALLPLQLMTLQLSNSQGMRDQISSGFLDFTTELRAHRLSYDIEMNNSDNGYARSSFESIHPGFEFSADRDRLTVSYSLQGARSRQGEPLQHMGRGPFPYQSQLDRLSVFLSIPFGRTEEPEPFEMRFILNELELDENGWAVFDPSGAWERGPINAYARLEGTAELLVDMFGRNNFQWIASLDPRAIRLHSIRSAAALPGLPDILLSGPGTALEAEVDLTFDPSDTNTAAGFPQPSGEIVFELMGLNSLLDNLVGSGLMEDRDMTILRGMIESVVPLAEDDILRKTAIFDENGGFSIADTVAEE